MSQFSSVSQFSQLFHDHSQRRRSLGHVWLEFCYACAACAASRRMECRGLRAPQHSAALRGAPRCSAVLHVLRGAPRCSAVLRVLSVLHVPSGLRCASHASRNSKRSTGSSALQGVPRPSQFSLSVHCDPRPPRHFKYSQSHRRTPRRPMMLNEFHGCSTDSKVL